MSVACLFSRVGKPSTFTQKCEASVDVSAHLASQFRGAPEHKNWVVVSNIFYFHPYLGKIRILTNIFQGG